MEEHTDSPGSPHILMVNYEFPPLGGGSGNATLEMLKQASHVQDFRIDLVTSGVGGSGITEHFSSNINIYRIPIAKREPHYWTTPEIIEWFVRAVPRSRHLVRSNRYDLCHCWGGWPAGLIGRFHRARMPYIVALRGSDVPGYNPRLRALDPLILRSVSRSVWRNAAAVTSVSRCLADLACQTDSRTPYEVIRNGVDCDRFSPGRSPERFTLLFVGRLIQRKGILHLLEAFRQVAESDSRPFLHIVGGGPERGTLEAFCRAKKIEGRVTFHGSVASDAIPELYQKATVFVMPSIEEAMSNAALEAMASGLPVITTNTGVSEIIDGNGIVVSRENPGELVDAIRRYLDDAELAARHGRRSREIASTMTWASVARAYQKTYRRILESSRAL